MQHIRPMWSALALLLLGTATARAQAPADEPNISVSAEATVDVAPDRAVVDVAVETQAETAQAATRENADKMDALLRRLRQQGIPERQIQTVSYQLHPVYARPSPDRQQEPRIVGYRAMNMVRVIVDSIPRVGPLIDAAVEAGGNRVAGLSFELSDPTSAREEALRQATARARREAEVLAKALGVELGRPLRASTAYSPPPRPFMRMAGVAMEEMQMAAPTPVEGGTIEVRADVQLVYAIRSP